MVSNASDDLPEPESPVSTMSLSRGRSRLMLRRLCSRAPRITRSSDTKIEPTRRVHPGGGTCVRLHAGARSTDEEGMASTVRRVIAPATTEGRAAELAQLRELLLLMLVV